MKLIFIFISFFIIVPNAESQFSFGSRAGMNIEGRNFTGLSLKNRGISPSGSFYINYRFKTKMLLQAEIAYSGGNNTESFLPKSPTGKIRSGQVRFPLMFQYKLKNLFADAGLQFRAPVNMKQKANGKKSIIVEDLYKAGTLGLALGGGYSFKNKLAGLRANIRCNIDFKLNNTGGNSIKKGFNIAFTYRLFNKKIQQIKPFKPVKSKIALA